MAAEIDKNQDGDPWDQMPNEPAKWYALFTEYRLLGPSRNFRRFYRMKRVQTGKSDLGQISGASAHWLKYFTEWHWKERAEAWDAEVREEQEAHTEQILGEGLALAHERIVKLKAVADKLEQYILDPKVTRVSPYILEQYRGLLDDIAKEKGERIKETRFTGVKGGPIVIETTWGRGGSASDAWQNSLPEPNNVIEAEVRHES